MIYPGRAMSRRAPTVASGAFRLLAAMVLVLAGCCDECEFPLANRLADPQIDVFAHEEYNQLFTRYGDGWTGGTGAASILLPDGRTLWLFDRVFLGTVNPDRSRPQEAPYVANALVVQDGDQLTTLVGGEPNAPEAYFRPAEPDVWYQPLGGVVADPFRILVLLGAFKSHGSGPLDVSLQRIDLASIGLPYFTLLNVETVSRQNEVLYGAALLDEGTYTYIYGTEQTGDASYLHVARVARRQLDATWTYYNGRDWSGSPSQSARIGTEVARVLSVFKQDGRCFLLSQSPHGGPEITLRDAGGPLGPFDGRRLLYHAPQSQGDVITHGALVHRHLGGADELVVSYNVTSLVGADVFADADLHRPFFIRVRGWLE